jgi:hypothetical protein
MIPEDVKRKAVPYPTGSLSNWLQLESRLRAWFPISQAPCRAGSWNTRYFSRSLHPLSIRASECTHPGCYISLLKSTRGSGCHKPHSSWTAIQNMRDNISQCATTFPCCLLRRKKKMIMMIIRYFLNLRAHSTAREPINKYVQAKGHILWW